MRPLGLLLGLLLCTPAAPAETSSPLRLLPEQSDYVLQVHQPRKMVEALTSLDLVKELQSQTAVKELLDSTQVRRFFQLVAYVEKEMGLSAPELLDRLAGGGIAVATNYGDKPPALLAIQGTDAATTTKFVKLAVDVIEQEIARQEGKAALLRSKVEGIEVISFGDDLHLAQVDKALLVSNKKDLLKKGLRLAKGEEKKSLADRQALKDAAKLLPKNPFVSIWLDMEPARKSPGFDAFTKTPRDPFITVVFGAIADIVSKTPYVAGALGLDERGLYVTFRTPLGTEKMGPEKLISAAPQGDPGSRPLLQPKNVLYTSSYYFDLSRFWTDRVALFGEERAKEIEKVDEQSGAFLANLRLSKFLLAAGPYQRIVAVHQEKFGYKKQPRNLIPAFAVVQELRKPEEFSKGMETVLRSAALLGGSQIGLKLAEEKYKDVNIIAYRFDENKEIKEDVDNIRFAFSPCFFRVGDQFVAASTIELGRELIDLLQAESTTKERGSPISSRTMVPAKGAKEFLKHYREQILTATILAQAAPLEEAKAQVEALFAMFDRIEGLAVEERYLPREFHFDLRLNMTKKR